MLCRWVVVQLALLVLVLGEGKDALLASTAHCALLTSGAAADKFKHIRCVAAHYPASSPPSAAWHADAPVFSPSADPHGCDAYTADDFAQQQGGSGGAFAAVVRRGGCSFGQKSRVAEAAGATSLLIIDSAAEPGAPGLVTPGGGDASGAERYGIPVAMVGAAEGESLLASLAAASGAPQGVAAPLRLSVRFEVPGTAAEGAAGARRLLRDERSKLHAHCLAHGESSYDCATLHRTLQEQLLAGTDDTATAEATAAATAGAAACSAERRASQLAYFRRSNARDSVEFNGEDEKLDTLLMLLHRLAPEPTGFIALDVGCARGDFSWAVQTLWNMHGVRVYDAIVNQPSPAHVFGAGLAVTHCFEPVPATFEVLRRAAAGGNGGGGDGFAGEPYVESARRAALFSPQGADGKSATRIHNLALSNASGEALMFTTEDVADSVVSSFFKGADPSLSQAVAVNVTTVDAFCFSDGFGSESPGALAHVDVLKIDTEGADPLVLAGAARMLAAGRVNLIAWEYGHVWTVAVDTGVHNLESTTAALDAMGYDSFLLGRERAIKLNGNCWARQYEFWWWSNIVSIRRDWLHREQLMALYDLLPWLGHSSREIRGK